MTSDSHLPGRGVPKLQPDDGPQRGDFLAYSAHFAVPSNVADWHGKQGSPPGAFRNVQTLNRIHPNPYYVRANDFPQLVLCGMEAGRAPKGRSATIPLSHHRIQ